MGDPSQEQSLEEKILKQIEDVEQKYSENENEIQTLKTQLQQRTAKRLQLKGEHTALKRLVPEELPAKKPKK